VCRATAVVVTASQPQPGSAPHRFVKAIRRRELDLVREEHDRRATIEADGDELAAQVLARREYGAVCIAVKLASRMWNRVQCPASPARRE
jgi:hypothetical protein